MRMKKGETEIKEGKKERRKKRTCVKHVSKSARFCRHMQGATLFTVLLGSWPETIDFLPLLATSALLLVASCY